MNPCSQCGEESSGQPACWNCGAPVEPATTGTSKRLLLIWLTCSAFAGATLALGSIFIIGFGMVGEFIRVFWGPAVGWMILGALALEGALRPAATLRGWRIAVALIALGFFSFAAVRIWERDSSPTALALLELDINDAAAVGRFLAAHTSVNSPEMLKLKDSWLKSEDARWSRIEKGDCDSIKEHTRDYPDGPHSQFIPQYQDACSWRNAQFFAEGNFRHEIANLKTYLAEAPLKAHRNDAQTRLEAAYWALVQQQRSNPESMAQVAAEYIQELPDGQHATEAKLIRARAGR